MSELREVFEMVTKQTEPDVDAWRDQERRQRRKSRNRKLGTLAVAIIIALVSFFALTRAFRTAERPADEPTPRPTPASLGSFAYAVNGDIYVAKWDGSHAVRIADGRPPSDCRTGANSGTGEYFVAAGPIWSPDGRYLAYRHADCDVPQDALWDVVISDPKGNVVTSFPSDGWGIPWSPDSTRVAVWVNWGEEPWTIGLYGLDGVRQTLLTPGVRWGEGDPVWSPDGESLLLGTLEIPLDGSPPRQLPGPDRPSAGETLSPDGSRVAYTTGMSLVVAEADGSDPEEVFGDWAGSIAWSPTGDRIAFTSGKPEGGSAAPWGTELRLLDVATGTVTLLTVTEGSDTLSAMAGAVFEFSPEGDRILFSTTGDWSTSGSSALESKLWSINTDGSDLRRLVAGTAYGDWLSLSPMP